MISKSNYDTFNSKEIYLIIHLLLSFHTTYHLLTALFTTRFVSPLSQSFFCLIRLQQQQITQNYGLFIMINSGLLAFDHLKYSHLFVPVCVPYHP